MLWYLGRAPLLQSFAPATLASLARVATRIELQRGQPIYIEGDPSDSRDRPVFGLVPELSGEVEEEAGGEYAARLWGVCARLGGSTTVPISPATCWRGSRVGLRARSSSPASHFEARRYLHPLDSRWSERNQQTEPRAHDAKGHVGR